MENNGTLDLSTLSQNIPAIIEEMVDFLKVSCITCFGKQGHKNGVQLSCQLFGNNIDFTLQWTGEFNEKMDKALGKDFRKVVDWAAVAISLLIIREKTDFTAIEQSSLGTTIDYYLIKKSDNSDLIFNNSACVEISGILQENKDNNINKRMKTKIRRLKSPTEMETYISVVEFSKPKSVLEKI